MVPLDTLAQITQRFEFVEAKLAEGGSGAEIVALSREYSDLKPIAGDIAAYLKALDDIATAESMLADPEMRPLAEEELPLLREALEGIDHKLRLALLPKDAADARDSGDPPRHWRRRGWAFCCRSLADVSALFRKNGLEIRDP
jgi:peptide chain release factor 1